MSQLHWQCPGCPRTLSTSDWTYADLANRGTPICGGCDNDMELVLPPDGFRSEVPCNAWIIVDPDDRSVVPCIYDDYEGAVGDANGMDNSLIVGLFLPAQLSGEEPEEEQADG